VRRRRTSDQARPIPIPIPIPLRSGLPARVSSMARRRPIGPGRAVWPAAALVVLGPLWAELAGGHGAGAAPQPGARATHRPAVAGCPAVDERTAPGAAARIWISPENPVAGGHLRAMVVSEQVEPAAAGGAGPGGQLAVLFPDGRRQELTAVRRGGPPFGFDAPVPVTGAGTYVLEWSRGGRLEACLAVPVVGPGARSGARIAAGAGWGAGGKPPAGGAWTTTRAWDRDTENFYSAWIESLFDAPPGDSLGFRPLAQALRDRARNFLFDHLALGEDAPAPATGPRASQTALTAEPDCADLPYFLRAYFSWKMGLPFGMRDCDRGTETRPPRCHELITNETPLPVAGASRRPGGAARAGGTVNVRLEAMKRFLRLLANKVHSGSARTALGDENTDYYPVRLTRAALRPGTIFADPYGHVLMLVHWVDQSAGSTGLLLAVDGQPDNSIGRKRFWEGTFLYANDVVGAGPGFKAFRPLVAGADGALAPLGNRALEHDARFAPFSVEQAGLDRDRFYAHMSKVIHPEGLDPATAYGETLDALVEQVTTRVGSVDNGEVYLRDTHDKVVPMPEGPKIFETVGPWEDYATPSRDLRLLIAIHVLESLPGRIVAHPDTFNLGTETPAAARIDIERLHARRIQERSVEYKRSDGSTQKLTIADVVARKVGLEMAYNPNDCVEVRWGAPPGSPEASTCHRHAPADQLARMEAYRSWFHDMRRPAR
jgi:hypothetical protein